MICHRGFEVAVGGVWNIRLTSTQEARENISGSRDDDIFFSWANVLD